MAEDDVIRIPIEIQTESLKELAKAKRDVNEVLRKQKKIKDNSGAQAVPTQTESSGIFGARSGAAVPLTGRDKTSKAPFQRQNEFKKLKDEVRKQKELTDAWKNGNVKKIQDFSSSQFGNVKQVAVSPFQFIFGSIARKLGKIGRAGLFVGIGLFISEIVKFVITEQLKPGRILDRRFRFLADKQILLFTQRTEQQQLRQKFKTVIVTTMPGLRGLGVEGQISGNLYVPDFMSASGLDRRLLVENVIAQGGSKRVDRSSRYG